MPAYKMLPDGAVRKTLENGEERIFLLTNPQNTDCVEFLAWVAQGNQADPEDPPTAEEVQRRCIDAVQLRLDQFAQTGGFDNIFTACTYANSKSPTRRAQGVYAVDARDAHWDKCQEILAAVEAGQRPVPTLEEVMAQMPPLTWPT